MIQIYADGRLVSDSRLEEHELLKLPVKTGLNKGGTAEIAMPPTHPAYNVFKVYKTIVEIYRDEKLKFRGRALYPVDDFDNNRTVVCEGERCFFQDGVLRPYLYQDPPEAIFTSIVETYNSQMEPFKRFKVGQITVTDPNNYVRLESQSATTTLEALDKLQERCGGYVTFTTDENGDRVVNWLVNVGKRSNQVLELGENLLDFARSGANTEMATAILPYGAKDEETGERVTIESVNDGVDYLKDDDAVQERGTIIKVVTWDDVTEPANLLRKAQEYLAEHKLMVQSLELTAMDLSYLDRSLDSYEEGDLVPVLSKPHKLDEDFRLYERSEDLLNPIDGKIAMGKETTTLTREGVAGDVKTQNALNDATAQVRKEYTANIAAAVQKSENTMTSLIQQTSEAVLLEVSRTYTTNDQLAESITSRMTQLEDQFLFEFEELRAVVNEGDAGAQAQITEIYNYISFENGDITLGGSENPVTLTLEKDLIVFKKNGVPFGWWDGVDFHTGNIVVEVNERAQFGNFAFVPRSNGSLSFLKVGG